MQPHAAGEVLDNQYGDCKDKHTLLASLLQAAGIPANPVLVNSTRKIDVDLPSPAQFDHVITQVSLGKEVIWLDTTPELAPFGLLLYGLRDKQALLVSATPRLVQTPATAPVPSGEEFEGKLQDDGTLQGKIQYRVQGDSGVVLRLAFRRVPQPNWKELVQGFSYKSGFMGTVDDVKVGALLEIDRPFDGIAVMQKAVELDPKPLTLNDVAYFLAEKQLMLDQAQTWAKKAVAAEEQETAEISLADLETGDLGHMRALASYWDTLGWVYFQIVGDHLGQLHEKAASWKPPLIFTSWPSPGQQHRRHRWQRRTAPPL